MGIEPGERLVEQHDPRFRRECSREADATLFSSGELLRAPRGVVRPEPDELERLARAGTASSLAAREAERDVLGDCQMREQRTLLGDVSDRSLVGRDVQAVGGRDHAAVDRDRPTVGRDEADDQAQQRGLAAPRCAENRGQRSLRDDEVDLLQHGASPVGLREAAQRSSATLVVRNARTVPKLLIST